MTPDSSRSTFRRALPWVLLAITVAFMIAGRALEMVVRQNREIEDSGVLGEIAMGLAFLGFPAVGALVASRQPRNSIGWLLLGIGALAAVGVFCMAWSVLIYEDGFDLPGGVLAAWIANWFWYPLITLIPTFLLLLFPTGRLPSRRWRPVAWVAGAITVSVTVLPMLQRVLVVEEQRVRNPIGFIQGDVEGRLEPVFLALIGVMVLCVISLIVRFVRGRGQERQQLKWAAVAAVAFGVVLPLGEWLGLPEILFPIALLMLPVAFGIAILKYRLYDIDVVINRTLVYGTLTAILVGAYALGVLVFRALLDPITGDNDLAIAASTLGVAALVGPARRNVQTFIDRRFYRSRYDAEQTLGEFSRRVRDEVDLEALSSELRQVVTRTMHPSHAQVWLVRDRTADA